MTTCTACGSDVTGKKFCQNCGTAVKSTSVPATSSQAAPTFCSNCGRQATPGERFCSDCGTQLGVAAAAPPQQTYSSSYNQPAYAQPQPYNQSPPYSQQPAYGQTDYSQSQPYSQYPQQSPYEQPQQPLYAPQQSYGQPAYPQQSPYGQPQYPQGQPGYQPEPMIGQQPMILRCPVCMAMSPLGTPNCPSCRTNLAGIVPTPANMPMQNQQGGIMGSLGGMMQGSGGKMAMGALGGAAAVIGGEMLLGGLEHGFEHRDRDRDEGIGGLGEIGRDLGLF